MLPLTSASVPTSFCLINLIWKNTCTCIYTYINPFIFAIIFNFRFTNPKIIKKFKKTKKTKSKKGLVTPYPFANAWLCLRLASSMALKWFVIDLVIFRFAFSSLLFCRLYVFTHASCYHLKFEHAYTHTFIHTYTHKYTPTYIHTHIHTYIDT